MNISKFIRYITLHIICLLGLIIVLTDGDLTLFSLGYLGKVCGTSILLFTSISLFGAELAYLRKLKNWQSTFIITGASNLAFLPFLILLSHEEHLSLWFPGLQACCFMMLWSIPPINLKRSLSSVRLMNSTTLSTYFKPKLTLKLNFNRIVYLYQEIWGRLQTKITKKNRGKLDVQNLKSIPSPQPTADKKITPFLTGKTVLVYGATSTLGQAFFDTLQSHPPKTLLLLDKDLIQLELLTIKLGKIHPQLEIHSFGINTLTTKAIQSIFSSYSPDFIFDFDRYFCLPSTDEGLATFLKTNLLIPYWLACSAHNSNTTLMVSLHPELIHPESSFIQAEKILMSSLQRLDSSNLRILNIKTPLFSDDLALPWYLQKLAVSSPKQTLLVDGATLLTNLLTLAQQLVHHPTHYGSLWSPLFAKKLTAKKLTAILKTEVTQQFTEIKHIEETKVPFKNLISTSHPEFVIFQDTINLDINNETTSYFLELEELLQKNQTQVEAFLQAA